ncbi:hypothetical protein Ahy_A02g009733 [Arachis hypogaea]|uniref:Uncharacterized protein n=1 Tax=Arachis hypogaea TaxID=3818 RepID=A0A445EI43_ARAHY|nr:hypothetical protein Ahy_A02g009733 [Arachis hypogaea]
MAGVHKIAGINLTIDNLCVRIRVIWLWTLLSYGNSPLPYSIEMVWLDEDVIFDKEAKQVLEKSCVEILDPLLLKGNLWDTPTLFLNLIDKTFLFIVEVQIYDNPHFLLSYKVKKMTDNPHFSLSIKNQFIFLFFGHYSLVDVDYIDCLFPISKTSSIIEGEKVEGAKNLLLELSNEVADNDKSEVLKNAITPAKRLFSESEDLKVQGDTSICKKIKIENET